MRQDRDDRLKYFPWRVSCKGVPLGAAGPPPLASICRMELDTPTPKATPSPPSLSSPPPEALLPERLFLVRRFPGDVSVLGCTRFS